MERQFLKLVDFDLAIEPKDLAFVQRQSAALSLEINQSHHLNIPISKDVRHKTPGNTPSGNFAPASDGVSVARPSDSPLSPAPSSCLSSSSTFEIVSKKDADSLLDEGVASINNRTPDLINVGSAE